MSAFIQKQADKLLNKVQNHQQSSSTPSPSPPRSKRGLCWPVENQDPVHIFTKPGSKISWIYNWSPNPTPNSTSLEFVPMQWNHVNIDQLGTCSAAASSLLAFNEPELPSQSNMSPQLAADEWIRCIEPLRKSGKARAGSPGISSAPDGVRWMQEFLRLIRERGGDVDFWCLHWYGEGLGGFYDYIWSTHHRLDPSKPVWITEFAPTNWNEANPLPKEHVDSFMKESIKYLDSLDWVERYAFFGPMRDTGTVGRHARFLDDDGKLTDLGRAYRDS